MHPLRVSSSESRVFQENKALRQKLEVAERENHELKKSLYQLSVRLNAALVQVQAQSSALSHAVPLHSATPALRLPQIAHTILKAILPRIRPLQLLRLVPMLLCTGTQGHPTKLTWRGQLHRFLQLDPSILVLSAAPRVMK